ncbi:unnamed protein product [Protopolystoma xenopodis]|uniref:Uncharacterized protein n=1 Tax=Protopolystoma xenopodis TaxID=117903 RepID=A0A3S5B1X3_9PLAT|nr:unnamed protein product [Protopolystoma xenopodis]
MPIPPSPLLSHLSHAGEDYIPGVFSRRPDHIQTSRSERVSLVRAPQPIARLLASTVEAWARQIAIKCVAFSPIGARDSANFTTFC